MLPRIHRNGVAPESGVNNLFIICLLINMTLIINNHNVWQPPVAKHCPITALPLTTTNTHPAAATVTAAPRKCPHGPSEGSCPSPRRGMWANNTPRHHPNPPPRRSLGPDRHVTAGRTRVRHVTAADDTRPPRHSTDDPRTPRHSRRQHTPATSSPKTTAYATSRTTTTA